MIERLKKWFHCWWNGHVWVMGNDRVCPHCGKESWPEETP